MFWLLPAAAEASYRLVGIVSTNKNNGIALVADDEGGVDRNFFLRVGGKISEWTVVDIQTRFVVLKKGKKLYRIRTGFGFDESAGIKYQETEEEIEIDEKNSTIFISSKFREYLKKEGLQSLLMSASSSPAINFEGNIYGFFIYDITKGGVFDRIGLTNGDLISAVNGVPLTSIASTLKALESIKDADDFFTTIVSHGIEYRLKINVK